MCLLGPGVAVARCPMLGGGFCGFFEGPVSGSKEIEDGKQDGGAVIAG